MEKPMTIVEFVEKVWECKLSDVQKELLTATYEFYEANHEIAHYGRGSARSNDVPMLLAVVFDAYKSGKL